MLLKKQEQGSNGQHLGLGGTGLGLLFRESNKIEVYFFFLM